MSAVAHFFMSVAGSKIHERLAHFFIDIYIQEQNHRTMALWAFDFAAETIGKLEEKYPTESRPREALEAVQDWAEYAA